MTTINTLLKPVSSGNAATMSSREIAQLTGSTHDNVLKTVRALIKKGVVSGNETPYVHPQNGQTYMEFHLDYRNTMVVTSGYSVELRAKIIDRWMELEVQQHKPLVPQTYAEALLEAGRIAKERDALEAENRELAPKAAGLEILAEKDGELGIRDAGRELKVGQNRVRDMLFDRKWACRQGRDIRPASYGLEHGYVRLVPRLYADKQTGQEKISDDFRITRKGIARLAEIFGVMEAGRIPFAKKPEPAPV